MRHIRLIVEYDGTDLCGWQRQANGPTVQGHLEAALARLLAHEVTVTGASRTDAGVHASGQVASFRTERAIPLHGVRRGLNSLLPPAIAVVEATEATDDFHPRFSATGKHYRYLLFTRSERSPRWRTRAWHHPGALDLPRMREASAALIGEHDFAAFRAAGCTAQRTVRRIDQIEISRLALDRPPIGDAAAQTELAQTELVQRAFAQTGTRRTETEQSVIEETDIAQPAGAITGAVKAACHDEARHPLIAMDVRGNAFLRNMVRIVVGTLVEVGEGRRPVAQVAEILASLDRTRAGITAPAHGLELISVSYGGRKMGPPHGVE